MLASSLPTSQDRMCAEEPNHLLCLLCAPNILRVLTLTIDSTITDIVLQHSLPNPNLTIMKSCLWQDQSSAVFATLTALQQRECKNETTRKEDYLSRHAS